MSQAVPAAVSKFFLISWIERAESAPGHLFHTDRSFFSSSKSAESPTSKLLEVEEDEEVFDASLELPLSFFFSLFDSFWRLSLPFLELVRFSSSLDPSLYL